MAVQQPGVVDPALGNLLLHGRGGLLMAINFQNADGTARDVTAAALFFEVDAVLRVALAAGSTADSRVVTLTRAQVISIAGAVHPFALIDETNAVPVVLWRASVRVEGFTAQPS